MPPPMIEDAKPELGTRPDAVPPRLQAHSKRRRTTGGFAMGFATVAFGPMRERPISAAEPRASCPLGPIPSPPSVRDRHRVQDSSIVAVSSDRTENGRFAAAAISAEHSGVDVRLRITPAKKRARCFDTDTPSAWVAQDDRQGATAQLRAIIATRT